MEVLRLVSTVEAGAMPAGTREAGGQPSARIHVPKCLKQRMRV